ncbi:MAG: hypothetical protein KKA05_08535 [Alphaproteobacteria bacterium]|nr:hypothetical protein [Alphaproteobacteria bacterium]MBU0858676.1 hypothetical protein [Alphaproteobacteria bacterium]
MKADRLERKTHFKKLSALPGGDVTVYDLTTVDTPDCSESTALASLVNAARLANRVADEIALLPQSFNTQHEILLWAVAAMGHSPVAHRLLERATQAGWRVGLTNLNNSGFYLDIPARTLLLDHFALAPAALGRSAYFRNALLTTFARALRDICHEENYGAFENTFGPEDVLMLERVRAADCDTVTLMVCWEMRGAGFSDVWRHLLGTQEGDMALIFTRCLERDPRALFDGTALAYAFRQWYADDARVDGCDHQTLEGLDDVLLLDGEGCGNPFGETRLTAAMIEELASLPDGTIYLAGLGATILKDPFYAGLNDPINQTHLFHLMYDLEVTMVNNVPFRDAKLAARIFPTGLLSEEVVKRG